MPQPVRLYSKGTFLGYQRAQRNQTPSISLIAIDGVRSREDTGFYLGKRVAFVYNGKKKVGGTRIRVIWGRVARAHGNSGVVRVRFTKNLPAQAMGASVRVMLYPSNV